MTLEELQKHVKEYYLYCGDKNKLENEKEWFGLQVTYNRNTIVLSVENYVDDAFKSSADYFNHFNRGFVANTLEEAIAEIKFAFEVPHSDIIVKSKPKIERRFKLRKDKFWFPESGNMFPKETTDYYAENSDSMRSLLDAGWYKAEDHYIDVEIKDNKC